MQGESAKRAIAWQQEKIELSNRHDFDLLEQRKEIENQLEVSADMRQKQKLDSKKEALNDAAERGDISLKEAEDEILRLELGLSSTLGEKKETNIIQDALEERDRKKEVVSQEQINTTELVQLGKDPDVPPEDQKTINEVVARGDKVEIKVARDTMKARKRLRSLTTPFREALGSVTGSLSPIAKRIRQKKIFDLTEEAELSTKGLTRPRNVPSSSYFDRGGLATFR